MPHLLAMTRLIHSLANRLFHVRPVHSTNAVNRFCRVSLQVMGLMMCLGLTGCDILEEAICDVAGQPSSCLGSSYPYYDTGMYGYYYGYGDDDDGDYGGGSSDCVDTNGGATDSGGDDCDWYDTYPDTCGDYDDADFRASSMCCACGGGSSSNSSGDSESGGSGSGGSGSGGSGSGDSGSGSGSSGGSSDYGPLGDEDGCYVCDPCESNFDCGPNGTCRYWEHLDYRVCGVSCSEDVACPGDSACYTMPGSSTYYECWNPGISSTDQICPTTYNCSGGATDDSSSDDGSHSGDSDDPSDGDDSSSGSGGSGSSDESDSSSGGSSDEEPEPGGSCAGGEGIYDCDLTCRFPSILDWVGDGYCDDSSSDGPNIYCAAFDYDGGDCDETDPTGDPPDGTSDPPEDDEDDSPEADAPADEESSDSACASSEMMDCDGSCIPATWLGDGHCDDGTWADLDCEMHSFDGGDCLDEDSSGSESGDDSSSGGSSGGSTVCSDTAGGATDSYGDGCEWYDSAPSSCGGYDDVDFTAGTMCCACGGGSTGGSSSSSGGSGSGGSSGDDDSCAPGTILDCVGACVTASWLGDGYCDDGTEMTADFDCAMHSYDGGDCLSSSSSGGSDGSSGGGSSSGSGSTELCENTCTYAYDGDCDDGGPGSDYSICELGTDCGDCGVRSAG